MFKRLAALVVALLVVTPALAMTAASIPNKFPIAWGSSAGGGYIRTIPTASQIGITNGAASLTDGFPPLTFLPVGSGGVPPFGQDFNGILNQITAWTRWQGAGGLAKYDGTFSSAVGGYPAGAILAGASPGTVWLNLADNNTTNPDSAGSNWAQFALTQGSSISGATITNSTIVLQQSGNPTPTTEGQIAWNTSLGQLAVGHNSATVTIPVGPAPGALYGLTIADDVSDTTHTIDFAAGQATDSTNAFYITLGSALNKQINNAWAAGSNAGGLFSGSLTNGTYHCFAIYNPSTGIVDAGFSTSVTASDRPAGYTYYRRVGSAIVSGGSIVQFVQHGNLFRRGTRSVDVNTTNPGTSAVTATLSVPTGIPVNAITAASYTDNNSNANKYLVLSALSEADQAASSSNFDVTLIGNISGNATIGSASNVETPTNSSGQIRYRVNTSSSGNVATIITIGWIDTRGIN